MSRQSGKARSHSLKRRMKCVSFFLSLFPLSSLLESRRYKVCSRQAAANGRKEHVRGCSDLLSAGERERQTFARNEPRLMVMWRTIGSADWDSYRRARLALERRTHWHKPIGQGATRKRRTTLS